MKTISLAPLVLLLFAAFTADATTVVLYPERDVTLIEDPHGERANGSGPALFVGRTSQTVNGIRRSLLYFDVAGAIPDGAIINDVSLVLHLTSSNSSPVDISLHRLLEDWSEGASSASGGSGAMAQPGDATWLHTNSDVAYWRRMGGHFVQHASAITRVMDTGVYSWQGSAHLLADVNMWHRAPERNFGWLLMGDEAMPQTAKRFSSRETPVEGLQPALIIDFRLAEQQ